MMIRKSILESRPASRRSPVLKSLSLMLLAVLMLALVGTVSAAPPALRADQQGDTARDLRFGPIGDAEQERALAAQAVSGHLRLAVTPAAGASRVRFYIDPDASALERGAYGATRLVEAAAGSATLDTTTLSDGVHTIAAVVEFKNGSRQTTVQRITVRNGAAALPAPAREIMEQAAAPAACTPAPCTNVIVTTPYLLDWTQDEGGLLDSAGVGTGFTMVDKSTNGTGYIAGNLTVDTAMTGTLNITTTAGINFGTVNSQDNALGVGINASAQITLETKLGALPPLTGNFEQAGLWFGNNEDNYVKIVVISEPSGPQVQYLVEGGGMTLSQHITGPLALAGATVALRLTGDPTTRIVAGYYSINGGAWTLLGQFAVPPEFFSQPPAVVDPQIGTATFGGIFATDRFLQGVALFKFDEFSLLGPTPPVVLDKKVYLPFILR